MSPLWCAALQGSDIVIRLLATISEKLGLQDELGRALFFAIRHGHQQTVDALLGLGANPGREMISNGLHGAASRGWKDEMCYYVKEYNVSVDIPDESFMTPVMYVIAGVPPPYDSDAIDCLFELGADTTAAIGDYGWTYTEYALAMGKKDLSRRLTTVAEAELDRQRHAAAATKAKLDRRRRRAAAKRDLTLPFEAAAAYPGSPTILNSSRESSCTVGRDNE
ncbi:hypothetical protein BFJ66_g13058 [Fusarium oxysporum f. sp. cepae]|nr:hypothetical protein BFJ66_g13058 [Fusarium oxysporum f. sp. cepae]